MDTIPMGEDTTTSNWRARIRAGLSTGFVGLLAGISGVAGSYAFAGFTPEYVVAPVATFTSQTAPGAVVTFAITTFGGTGDLLNLALATVLAVVLLAIPVTVAVGLGGRFDSGALAVGLAATLAWLVASAVTMALVPSLGAGLGAGLVVAVRELVPVASTNRAATVDSGRRSILGTVAATLGIGAAGYVLGGRRETRRPTSLDAVDDGKQSIPDLLELADERSLAIEGIDDLVSGDDFYEVDIYNVNPNLSADDWTLSVTGEVEAEREFTYDDLRGMDAQNRFVTLRCVGEQLNGDRMDNALWTGVPVMDVVEQAGLQGDVVVLKDGDGYAEEFSVDALRGGLLAYGKDGRTLPRQHGFPVRALIPGHWGEINVKWLTEIEIRDEEVKGYWEKRGWHGTGPVNTVAKLHAVNRLDDGRVQVGGHAYAGTRGVERVEVSTDGGETWTDATLSDPLPDEYGTDVWRQWMYEYDPPPEDHEVVVRATDGTGTLQPRERADAFPSGATGWVSRTVSGRGSSS